jgi:DNA-binding response OmpR family regulator
MARILIVEDEPEIAAALAYDLQLEGYEVEVVRDGESASACGRPSCF